MMRVADDGFFPWLVWAFFKWDGKINRLPYLGALACLLLLLTLYTFLVGLAYVHFIIPPPEGTAADMDYMLEMLRSGAVSPFAMLPLTVISIMLDAKRLRGIGAWPWIAVIMNALNFLRSGVEVAGPLGSIISIAGMAYLLILLLIPPKNTARPVNRGFPGRSGGGPRRMSGKELTNWRLIAPAPRRTENETPEQDRDGEQKKE